MTRSRNCVVALLATTFGLLVATPARAGSWQNGFTGFGATLKGDLYTPTTPAAAPAVLVAIHMCTGHSTTVHGWFDAAADKAGFYIIAPDAGKQCFDSSASRDGDKAAIVTMVNYLITTKNADKTRVFAAGMSSGGCMTNTLLAIYPDVFAGGSAMPGFPAGGWPAGDITCTKCGSTPPSTDGAYWGNIARKAFTWSGTYPCSQQWVGGGDEYNFNGWLPAVAAQFQNLSSLGSGMPASGRSGWTRTVYKDSAGNVRLETNLGPTSQAHDLETVNPTLYGDVVTFLGIDKPTGSCGLTSTSTGAGGGTGAGGAAAGSGGTTGSAGSTGSGGMQTGTAGTTGGAGMTGSAGSTGSGGATGSAGSTGSAGATGSGGSTKTGSGGSSSTGSGGSQSGDNRASGGCTVVAGRPQSGSFTMLLFVVLGLGVRLRARRRR
jgi:endo-1,4-beta-xylanase